jgi:hypothetical protein
MRERAMTKSQTIETAYKRVLKLMSECPAMNMQRLPGTLKVPLREVVPGTRPIMIVEMG